MLGRLAARARRLYLQSVAHRSEGQGALQERTQRLFSSKLPAEYQGYYLHKPLQPNPRPPQQAAPEASPVSSSEAATAESADATDNVSVQGARAASAWMLPWERRQMDGAGTPLRTWEKLYWGLFVAGLATLMFSRLYRSQPPDPKIDEEKEARRRERARLILAGHSFTEEDDPFEGLTPQEIQQYVQKETAGASESDPFEGMSPEEINEYMAKHGSV